MIRSLLVAVLLLAGCSSSAGAARSSSVAPRSTSASSSGVDAVFLSVARKAAPTLTDAWLLRYGHAICTDLRNGSPWVAEVASLVHDSRMSGYNAGMLIGASVAAFCPDQQSKTP